MIIRKEVTILLSEAEHAAIQRTIATLAKIAQQEQYDDYGRIAEEISEELEAWYEDSPISEDFSPI